MENIKINRDEALRYLGHKNQIIDTSTNKLIDQCIAEVKNAQGARYIYKIFDINIAKDEVEILDARLKLKGEDIAKHLKGCSKCAIMAATLGIEIDNKIIYYEKTNLTKSIIFDACATAGIESLCDNAENEIKEVAKKDDLSITSRYSPGYGDFSLEIQPQVLDVLDSYRKIGLSVTENLILIPRKSVTAVIGFQKEQSNRELRCEKCSFFNKCQFKKGGGHCEYQRFMQG